MEKRDDHTAASQADPQLPRPGKKIKTEYTKGDETETGDRIKLIFGTTRDLIIYLTEKNTLRWEINSGAKPDHFPDSLIYFNDLSSKIEATVSGTRTKIDLYRGLGKALYTAITGPASGVDGSFAEITELINKKSLLIGRRNYVLSGSMAMLLLNLGLLAAYNFKLPQPYFSLVLGIAMGALGALISVLLRSNEIELPEYSSLGTHVFHGVSRIILGSISGLALIFLVRGDLVIGVIKDNVWSVAVFGILAGLSERYVPSILEGLGKSSKSSETPEAGSTPATSPTDREE